MPSSVAPDTGSTAASLPTPQGAAEAAQPAHKAVAPMRSLDADDSDSGASSGKPSEGCSSPPRQEASLEALAVPLDLDAPEAPSSALAGAVAALTAPPASSDSDDGAAAASPKQLQASGSPVSGATEASAAMTKQDRLKALAARIAARRAKAAADAEAATGGAQDAAGGAASDSDDSDTLVLPDQRAAAKKLKAKKAQAKASAAAVSKPAARGRGARAATASDSDSDSSAAGVLADDNAVAAGRLSGKKRPRPASANDVDAAAAKAEGGATEGDGVAEQGSNKRQAVAEVDDAPHSPLQPPPKPRCVGVIALCVAVNGCMCTCVCVVVCVRVC